MKYLFCLFFFILSLKPVDYKHLNLYQAIDRSELIVETEIQEVKDTTLIVNVLSIEKGKINTECLEILQFKNWPCAYKRTAYKVGQQAYLFLRQDKTRTIWRIVGAGNDGEMPIVNQKAYYKSPYRSTDGIFGTAERLTLPQGRVFAFEFTIAEVKEGIYQYKKQKVKLTRKLNDKSLLYYCPTNPFLLRIVEGMILENYRQFADSRGFRKLKQLRTCK